MFYAYILKSVKSSVYYIGSCENTGANISMFSINGSGVNAFTTTSVAIRTATEGGADFDSFRTNVSVLGPTA